MRNADCGLWNGSGSIQIRGLYSALRTPHSALCLESFFQAFYGKLLKELFSCAVSGYMIFREIELPKLKLYIASLGNLPCIDDRLRQVGEGPVHLFRGFQVELIRRELQPLCIRDVSACLDAQEDLVGAGILPLQIVAIPCGNDWRIEPLCQGDQVFIHLVLISYLIVLDLKEEVLLSKDLSIFPCGP